MPVEDYLPEQPLDEETVRKLRKGVDSIERRLSQLNTLKNRAQARADETSYLLDDANLTYERMRLYNEGLPRVPARTIRRIDLSKETAQDTLNAVTGDINVCISKLEVLLTKYISLFPDLRHPEIQDDINKTNQELDRLRNRVDSYTRVLSLTQSFIRHFHR